MKLIELNTGDIFNIENTPSYPKLKTNNGYVDLRDDIINNDGNCDKLDVYKMSIIDISKQFDEQEKEIQIWIDAKKLKYL